MALGVLKLAISSDGNGSVREICANELILCVVYAMLEDKEGYLLANWRGSSAA